MKMSKARAQGNRQRLLLIVSSRFLRLSLARELISVHCSGFGRAQLPKSDIAERYFDHWSTEDAHGTTQRVPAERPELAGYSVRARHQRHIGG